MVKQPLSERIVRKIWRGLVRIVSCRVFFSVLLVALIPFIMRGAAKSWGVTENRVEEWVPASLEETKRFIDFMWLFGGDETLILSWDGCEQGSPELALFRQKLLEPVEWDGASRTFYRAVFTGDDVRERLTAPPINMSDEAFHARFDSFLYSTDGSTVALVALISEDGMKYRRPAVKRVWEIADEIPGLGRDKIRVGGSTTDSVSMDDVCRDKLFEMNAVTYVVGILILLTCFHNLRVSLLVFSISFLNQQICLALIYYLGVTFDSVLMLAVNLTFVLSLSSCIHLANYYFAARPSLPPKLAVYRMLRDAIVPVSASVITTMLGLLSLQSGILAPARRFSAIAALSLAILTFVVIVYISIHFLFFPLKDQFFRKNLSPYPQYIVHTNFWGKRSFSLQYPDGSQPTFRDKFGERAYRTFSKFGVNHPILTLLAVIAILGVCGYELQNVQTRVGLRQSLKSSTRQIQDYEWLEEKFGPLIPVEIALRVPVTEDKDAFLNEFYSLQHLVWRLQDGLPDSTIITALNFMSDLPDEYERSFRATSARSAFRNVLYENRESLTEAGYYREREDGRFYRVTCRTYAMRDVDYGEFTQRVEEIVKSALTDAEDPSAFKWEDALVTGSVPLVQRVQKQLIFDLQLSFFFAFVTIGIVLAVIYRSVWCGLLAVFPCVFPCVFVFGLVGLLGIKIELGTMLTGSAALGVAADDVVHFIAWFRLGAMQPYHTRKDAVAFAFRNCALAMFETTAVIVIGLTSYLMSDFIPTVYFTIFMAALLITAHLASYIILPAILVLPTGELFLRPLREREAALQREADRKLREKILRETVVEKAYF